MERGNSPLRRTLVPLLLLLLLAAGLAAAHNRSAPSGRPAAVEGPAQVLLRPVQSLAGLFSSLWNAISAWALDKAHLEAENTALKHQVDLVTLRNRQLVHVAEQNDRLRALLRMNTHDSAGIRWICADVLERHPSHWFDLLTLDCGSRRGVTPHSVVLTPEGLVGRVSMVRPDSCDVLLITDPTASTGAIVTRTHDVGYVQGTGNQDLSLSFFDRDHGIKVGDPVYSSPYSSTYPSGILIGWISDVRQDSSTGAKTGSVRPAVRFDSLEEAIVVP